MIQIKEVEKVKLKNPLIIEGFPGIGMIGTITASYLAQKLDMKLIGYFASPSFPPISAIHDFKPVIPARIYASEKHDLIVLFSEFVIPATVIYPLAEKIIEWSKTKKVKAIYSLAGIAIQEPSDKLHAIASTKSVADSLSKQGFELVKEGATQGVSGVLIAECAAQKFPAANLMSETNQAFDPKASAKLLKKVSEILNIPVDVVELENQGKEVELKMKDAIQKMQSMHQDYQKLEQNPMYG
ncbi:proteasome assembly chaperone family protein [Candidatus Micrarchaeota archaeon]|nr:proteasome assembly chaperone family protein [Candidatus Micrarchaeota archaeon]